MTSERYPRLLAAMLLMAPLACADDTINTAGGGSPGGGNVGAGNAGGAGAGNVGGAQVVRARMPEA